MKRIGERKGNRKPRWREKSDRGRKGEGQREGKRQERTQDEKIKERNKERRTEQWKIKIQ